MSYQIITGTSKTELEQSIAEFIANNPTYSKLGGVAVNSSTWAQAVDIVPVQSGGGGGTAVAGDLTIQAMTNLPCNVNQNSFSVTGAIPIPYKSVCVQVDVSGADANTGVLKLQYSLTGAVGTFIDVPSQSLAVTSGNTSNYFNVFDFVGKFLTIDWTKGTNTTGTMNAVIYCK